MEIVGFENITLAQKIAESVALQISEQVLKPGQRLLENELTEHFGTSRAPIREALFILEKEGIVERISRRGVFVKKYTEKELTDLYDTIYRLEEVAFDKVIQLAQDEQLKQLVDLVDQMDQATVSKQVKKYIDLVEQFHLTFFTLSGNEILKELYLMLIKRVKPLRYMSITHHSSMEYSMKEYKGIIEGLMKSDLKMVKTYLQMKEKRALSVVTKIMVQSNL